MLVGSLLAGQVETPVIEPIKADVRRLVRQLDSPQLAEREAAEAELLRRGPAILDLLPQPGPRVSAEVRQRLGRIRQKLQQQAAEAAARSSTITLQADAMPLSNVLAAFQRQSGNKIADCREKFGQPAADPKLKVRFDKTPFWLALDRLLDQAGLTVYPFSEQAAIDVVVAPPGEKSVARTGRACYAARSASNPSACWPAAISANRAPNYWW